MATRTRCWLATCIVACALSSSRASADILIESYRGERPADAERELEPLRRELTSLGIKTRVADVLAEAGEQLPLPGVAVPGLEPAYPTDPAAQVEQGVRQVFHAEYEAGLATLASVLDAAHHNPDLVIADASSPTWLTKAYAAVAFAQLRSGHPDLATQAVVAQIHSFPDQPIGRVVGPEVAALADSVRAGVDAAPHGILRITTTASDIQAFLDEHARGRGSTIPNLPAGKYRLLLTRGDTSRRYSVAIAPERITDLRIDWEADASLQVTADWLGFAGTRGQEDRIDAAVARYARGARQHDLYVASIVQNGERRFLAATIFEKQTGVLLRRKAIELGKDDGRCVRALALHLAKGEPSPCLLDVPADADASAAHASTSRDPYLLPGLLTGAGIASALGGVAVLAGTRDPASGEGGRHYASAPGVALVAGGALAIGVASYLAYRASGRPEAQPLTFRRSRAPVYASALTAAAAFAAGGYLLHLDGAGTCGIDGPVACPYRYHSAGYGYALIGAGVATAAFGIYWYASAPVEASAPTMTLTPTASGAMASIGGSF